MFETPAFAQAAGASATGGPSGLLFVVPYVLVFAIIWFLVFRPQQQKVKEQRAQIAAVKKGDTVVTAGGIVGKATRVDDAEVEIEIAPNTRVKVVKATLAEVRPLGGSAKPAND